MIDKAEMRKEVQAGTAVYAVRRLSKCLNDALDEIDVLAAENEKLKLQLTATAGGRLEELRNILGVNGLEEGAEQHRENDLDCVFYNNGRCNLCDPGADDICCGGACRQRITREQIYIPVPGCGECDAVCLCSDSIRCGSVECRVLRAAVCGKDEKGLICDDCPAFAKCSADIEVNSEECGAVRRSYEEELEE